MRRYIILLAVLLTIGCRSTGQLSVVATVHRDDVDINLAYTLGENSENHRQVTCSVDE